MNDPEENLKKQPGFRPARPSNRILQPSAIASALRVGTIATATATGENAEKSRHRRPLRWDCSQNDREPNVAAIAGLSTFVKRIERSREGVLSMKSMQSGSRSGDRALPPPNPRAAQSSGRLKARNLTTPCKPNCPTPNCPTPGPMPDAPSERFVKFPQIAPWIGPDTPRL